MTEQAQKDHPPTSNIDPLTSQVAHANRMAFDANERYWQGRPEPTEKEKIAVLQEALKEEKLTPDEKSLIQLCLKMQWSSLLVIQRLKSGECPDSALKAAKKVNTVTSQIDAHPLRQVDIVRGFKHDVGTPIGTIAGLLELTVDPNVLLDLDSNPPQQTETYRQRIIYDAEEVKESALNLALQIADLEEPRLFGVGTIIAQELDHLPLDIISHYVCINTASGKEHTPRSFTNTAAPFSFGIRSVAKVAIGRVINNAVKACQIAQKKRNASDYQPSIAVVMKIDLASQKYIIHISDNGIGMDKERREILQKVLANARTGIASAPLTGQNGSSQLEGMGIGLGLAAIRLAKNGGAISLIKSKPWRGTKIRIVLPITQPPTD